MGFYDLSKEKRVLLVSKINQNLLKDLKTGKQTFFIKYFSDDDTYIRKSAYLAIGKIYKEKFVPRENIVALLHQIFKSENFHIRQTVVNSAGEIGVLNFQDAQEFLDTGLFDEHHTVRNAVIGSLKKIGQKNPKPSLEWAKTYLKHPDKEIRREICHGIELRGRTHPEDILPMLKELEFDTTARVHKTLVHVLGQISYKKNCLERVLDHLKEWKNKELVHEALEEIVDVHDRYKNFVVLSQEEAISIIRKKYPSF